MTIEEVKFAINSMVAQYGYFVNGYNREQKVGSIVPVAVVDPELGNCLIIGESSRDEMHKLWSPFRYKSWNPGGPVYYYRAMID